MLAGFDLVVQEAAFIIEGGIGLGNPHGVLRFGRQVSRRALDVHHPVDHAAVRRLEEAHFIYLGMHAKRGDKTNVGSLRRFDRAEAAVVRVVYVANLKARALS